jgi:carbon monoxide dehydrogenase subunit G
MRVERDILIDASPEEIWELVSKPDNYDRFWHGLTRLERKNEEEGLGARFALRMRIGSADIGGLIEIVEYDEPADMAWTSITGSTTARAGGCARPRTAARRWCSGSRGTRPEGCSAALPTGSARPWSRRRSSKP